MSVIQAANGLNKPVKRKPRIGMNDTLVSAAILQDAVKRILKNTILDRNWDIPYLAGYSRDGKTIYIDRHLPKYFGSGDKKHSVDPFLILHESVEKSLIDELGLVYQHAHQIALRAEEAAVNAHGISWKEYDNFMQDYIKSAGHEQLVRIPPDLDIKPYHDEHDTRLLLEMQAIIRNELDGVR
jgi:hypothetical protein